MDSFSHLSISGALERVSNDEAVLDLSENLGRLFSITRSSKSLTYLLYIFSSSVAHPI